jgi:hypothetical protein
MSKLFCLAAAAVLAAVSASAEARGGGSHAPHQTANSSASPASGVTKRDAASGLPTGKRIHKPISGRAAKQTGAANGSHGSLLRGNNGGGDRKGGRY